LSAKKRRVAEALAQGDSTNDVADEFGVSAGRVSQLRREFAESWQEFHGPVSENGMTGQVGLLVKIS
jgi:transposase-like protein